MENFSRFMRENWLILLVLLIPFPVIGWYWNQFPQQIPIHWNAQGQINGYAPKGIGIFLTPALNILLFFCLAFIWKIDPKKENYDLFKRRYLGIRLSIHLFILVVFAFIMLTSLKYPYDFNKAMQTALLLFLLILGNYLSAVRPNYFVGIRTPWTLANEDVWVKTHRFTGRLWVIGCILMLIAVWALPVNMSFIVGGITLLALIPVVYSYFEFRKVKHHHPNGQ